MFRTFRARASTLSLRRLSLRVHSNAHQRATPVEKIRFVRAGSRSKAIISSLLTVTIFYGVFNVVVFSPLEELVLDEETVKEVEEQAGSIFIPFPGTTKQVQPPPYRGSDPEWQEYVKFSKNPALGKRIRDELAAFAQQTVGKHPILTVQCGKEIKLRRYWLDVDFPLIPPPEFERSGIEIAGDHIAWTTMPVDSLTVFRIRQALWPSALTQSLWSFSKVILWSDASILGGMLGIQTKPQPSFEAILAQHTKRSSARSSKSTQSTEENASPPTATANRDLGERTPPNPNRAPHKKPSEGLDALTNAIKSEGQSTRQAKENTVSAMNLQLLQALLAFRTKFRQTWRPAPDYPPRGSIFVSGLVELDSPKAWLVVDVKAAWDPKTKTYDARTMHLALRRLQMKRQAPVGGR